MSRMGKKTLYLDLDAVERVEAALAALPGRPSLSSFLTDQLPQQAEFLEELAGALSRGGVRGSVAFLAMADKLVEQHETAQAEVNEALLSGGCVLPLERTATVPLKKVKQPSAKQVKEK